MEGSIGKVWNGMHVAEELQTAEVVPRDVGSVYLYDLKVCLKTTSSQVSIKPG